MARGSPLKNLVYERQLFILRCLIAAVGVVVLISILVTRLVTLQVENHAYYSTRSDDNRLRVRVVPPVRGLVYDRNGNLLAENLPSYRMMLIPEQVEDLEETLVRLGQIIRIEPRDIERFKQRASRNPRFRGTPLRFRLTPEEVARFEVNRQYFPGVDIVAGLTRSYPQGATASHIVGYVGGITEAEMARLDERRYRGTTHTGKVGVERSHEDLLHGRPGTKIVEANASGRVLRELEYDRPVAGRNLYLTIDADLQREASEALGDHTGSIVALDPRNGELLAMVSHPGYDPHLFIEGIDHETYRALNDDPGRPLFNRGIQGQYPPGSTVKPVMALAGLENGVISPHRRHYCPGVFMLPNSERRYRDWKRDGHGSVNMRSAIAQSCDIYFYELSIALGIDRISTFVERFGLGSKLGVDLPGEKRGLLPSRQWKRRARNEAWYPGETINVGIGQGFMTATPLQLAHMTAVIAGRGRAMRPHILRSHENALTGELIEIEPVAVQPVILKNSDHWKRIVRSMIAVTHSPIGTAQRIGLDASYRMASKTGTAQVTGLSQEDDEAPELEDVPRELRDHALFVAFAPAVDPRIAIAVVIEHGGSGGAVAAPVARKVMDAWLLRDKP